MSRRIVRVGDRALIRRIFTAADIDTFARLVGDNNPVHLDPNASKALGFDQRRIVHGMLQSSLFSFLMGMVCPGVNSIYLTQSLAFRAPVYCDEEVEASIVITKVRPKSGTFFAKTTVSKAILLPSGESKLLLCTEGEAMGLNRTIDFSEEPAAPVVAPEPKL
jgi:acyl dehydratase